MSEGASRGEQGPSPDFALCLSGGGFRATLFHLGALQRLNELGILSRVGVFTSVSGGSILNGILAANWSKLCQDEDGVFSNFETVVGSEARRICGIDLRTKLLLVDRINPRYWPHLLRRRFSISGNMLANEYDVHFGKRLLRELSERPGDPRFVFCATNLLTGACWQFHSGPNAKMGDFYTGYQSVGNVRLADAVAASSAFPPGFAPLELTVVPDTFDRNDPWGINRPISAKRQLDAPANKVIPLTDGGVYDNLGVEPVWNKKTLLVSDAGHPFSSVGKCGAGILGRLRRVVDISGSQVLAVRKRWLIDRFLRSELFGAYWGIDTNPGDYGLADGLAYTQKIRALLCTVRTDLNEFTSGEMKCLENHGYLLADAAIRSRALKLVGKLVASAWPHIDFSEDKEAGAALASSARRFIMRDVRRMLFRG